MKHGLQAGSPLLFRPRVTPEPAAMESLQKKLAAFSYTPEQGLHRDKVQPRLRPVESIRTPSWTGARSARVVAR